MAMASIIDKVRERLPNVSGVAAGEQFVVRLSNARRRLHDLYLNLTNITAAQLTDLQVIVNNRTIMRFSGTQLDTLNQYWGLGSVASRGYLRIPFDRPRLNTRAGREMTALNIGVADRLGAVVDDVRIEGELDGAVVSPAVQAFGDFSRAVEGGPGLMRFMRPEGVVVTASGEKEHIITDVGRGERLYLNAAYAFSSNITEGRLIRSNTTIFDAKTAMNEGVQTDGIRAPQAGLWVIDTTAEGHGEAFIPLFEGGKPGENPISDFRYQYELSASGNFNLFQEFLGRLPV